jgi:hypothetical protein
MRAHFIAFLRRKGLIALRTTKKGSETDSKKEFEESISIRVIQREAKASNGNSRVRIPDDILCGRNSSARCLSGGVSKLLSVDNETLRKVAALFGEDAVRVVEVLKGVYEITDYEIADETQMQLKMVRKALYRLYDHFLLALRQHRDKETGWFIFN